MRVSPNNSFKPKPLHGAASFQSQGARVAYDLHIEKNNSQPISEAEWNAAVLSTPYVRKSTGTVATVNQNTGERIEIQLPHSNAEVCIQTGTGPESEWQPVFSYSIGRVTFAATPALLQDPLDPVRQAAIALCTKIGARIVGDEGEVYVWDIS